MSLGLRLGKSLGEITDMTREEIQLWAAYFEMEAEHVKK